MSRGPEFSAQDRNDSFLSLMSPTSGPGVEDTDQYHETLAKWSCSEVKREHSTTAFFPENASPMANLGRKSGGISAGSWRCKKSPLKEMVSFLGARVSLGATVVAPGQMWMCL